MGWNRVQGADARPNGFMSIPFIIISVLGLTMFCRAGAWPVGLLFTGLALVYVAELFASFRLGVKVAADGRESTNLGEKALGVLHIVVGLWLMYLTVATTLGITPGFHLPRAWQALLQRQRLATEEPAGRRVAIALPELAVAI